MVGEAGEPARTGADGVLSSAAVAEDPDKKAKKAAKQAEKDAKKQKAAAKKKEAEAAEKRAQSGQGESKKAAAKREAEAKKERDVQELAAYLDKARATPNGQKKDYSGDMPKVYDPKIVEAATYAWWEESGYFKPDEKATETFSIVIPPPNVTGSLHIGHALTLAVEDTVVRWHRMNGKSTLWVPGTDHAGIATQTAVEKMLARKEKVTRYDLGRQGFQTRCDEWVAEYGGRIYDQIRRMGASPDWSQTAYTLDPALCAAVLEAFVRFHDAGLIYRHNRLVNWDCRLKTAVSDIEVDYVDVEPYTHLEVPGYIERVEFGVLTSFAYKLADSDDEIVVATTRPETMLGDAAVAVHPDDSRYKQFHGRFLEHPLDKRKIPIILDAELVDMQFGTGAVKITPAHDPNDFASGQRHKLTSVNLYTDEGCINDNGGKFAGQPRFQARVTVVAWLKELGLFRGTEGNKMRLGVCSRSRDVIEPVLKPQWYVDCQGMAKAACEAVRDGRLQILPAEFNATWFRWMENIRDWCISRQLWFGHRIPAYYVTLAAEQEAAPGGPSERMDRWIIAASEDAARHKAAQRFPGEDFRLQQDEDVLDTWFSSGLFPFSTLGWPENTQALQKFYPTSLLETGHDILFFWVARMVMMGMQLTGEVPFSQVYLHSMVRDAHGRKMSKSLGNVIDPLAVLDGITLDELHETLHAGNLDPKEIERAKAGQKADFPDGIEECGADALRFALVAYTSQARDVNLDIKRVVGYRHWCNKLWNAVRFAAGHLPDGYRPNSSAAAPPQLPWACRWILSRLDKAVQQTNQALQLYSFADATTAVYDWWQYRLCDVFIELVKPVMQRNDQDAGATGEKAAFRDTLWTCLDTGLRLLHPFMPYVTEDLWQRLPRDQQEHGLSTIMLSSYPQAQPDWQADALEDEMEFLLKVVSRLRNARTSYGLTTRQQPPVHMQCSSEDKQQTLRQAAGAIAALVPAESATLLAHSKAPPHGCVAVIVDDSTTAYLLLQGALDPEMELAKLQAQQAALQDRLDVISKQMAAAGYAQRSPQEVQAADRERIVKSEAELAALQHLQHDMRQLLLA